jgi:hypothetical protein
MYNSSLREEPRDQRAAVVNSKRQASILDWLEGTGRLLAREPQDRDLINDDEEIEEINELIAGDDVDYDDTDDTDLDD